MARPTFMESNLPVRAAGFTFFSNTPNGWRLLLMLSHPDKGSNAGKYIIEDAGGKTDIADYDIESTAAREVWEETNHAWHYCDLLYHAYTSDYYFESRNKYMHYFVEIEWFENLDIFGTRESHVGLNRIFVWVDPDKLHLMERNPRLSKKWISEVKHFIKLKNKKPCIKH